MTLYLLIVLSWFLVGLALVTLRVVNEREPEAQWRLLLAAAATPFLLFPLAGVCRVALEQISLLVPVLDSPVPLVAVTGAGAAIAVGRIVRIRRRQRALLASCQLPEPEAAAALSGHLTELSRTAGLRRAPRVVIYPRGASVCVLGFRRPTVVISRDLLTVLADQELRAVLAHEIAHVRRRDYLLNWLGVALRAALFYLPPWPVAWQILAEAREHRADRLAATYTADPLTLASALIKVWRYTPGRLAPWGAVGLLARHGRLEARIRRLLEPPPGRPFWRTAVTGVVLGGGLLLAQTTVDAGTHFLARVSPAIRDREACCDPGVSPLPHCVPSRRVFLPLPTTECSRAWTAGPVAKTGIVYRATASIGGWGTVLLSTFSKAPVDGLAELDRSAAVREFRAFARFPWRTVTSFRRLRGRDARWSRWVNASVACGLAVATPQTGSASDPLFSTVSVTHVSGGVQAPDFALATADGKKVALAGLKGNVVLLNFWATWCPPCREEMPSMERLHQELREQGRPPPLAAPSAWRGGSAASGSFEGRPSRGGPIGPRWSALLTVVGEV